MGPLHIQPLECLGILFIIGYLGGRCANHLGFPRVTGYIVAGVLLSPSVSGILPAELINDKCVIINDIALGVIAFSVGGSLKLSKVRQLGKTIFIINITESFGSFILSLVLISVLGPYILRPDKPLGTFVEVYLPLSLIVAAVSAATAPAAILAIVHEIKAKGPLTTTLLGVVALDDGMAIIFFAFARAVVRGLMNKGGMSLFAMVVDPVTTIFGSLAVGAAIGSLMVYLTAWVKKRESLLIVILGSIFICSGIAEHLDCSPLLANMMAGFVIINMGTYSDRFFIAVENIEEPLFALFFTLAGSHFDVKVFKMVGMLAVLIAVSCFIGKFIGARLGAELSHAPEVVKKYLGYGLLPKAGVTLGLVFMARSFITPDVFEIMVNAILGSVIINELIAPPLVKYALTRAGEGVKE
ncbi:cation:proton antiporter [Desulfatiferula olefinivorans]